MTQEFVTLTREVVEQAIEALFCTDSEEGSAAYENELEAVKKLRAALDQQQNHILGVRNMAPAGWKLVPVEPNCSMVLAGERSLEQHDFLRLDSAYRAMLAAAPQPPAPGCKATKRGDHVVCDDCKSAWDANDKNPPACVPAPPAVKQPHVGKEPDWKDLYQKEKRRAEMWIAKYEKDIGKLEVAVPVAAQPQVEQEPRAWLHIDRLGGEQAFTNEPPPSLKAKCQPLYTHSQNLNCKSNQARLATLWGYTKEQPKREPLTNEQVKAGLIHSIEYTDARERCAFNIGVRFAERAHNIK